MSLEGTRNCRRYSFGEFLLDAPARELRQAGRLLMLSPKVFDCVLYLIERRDRAVGRDELIAAVWGRTDVADVQLRYLMRKLRRTLGDSGDGQTLIRTVPRFGFRWVAELKNCEEFSNAIVAPWPVVSSDTVYGAVVPSEPSYPSLQRAASLGPRYLATVLGRRRIAALVVVALLVAVALVMGDTRLRVRRSPAAAAVAGSTPSSGAIAVLPVSLDTAKDADSAWMPLGLMDLIASRLHRAGLAVVSSSDVVALTPHDGQSNNALAAKVRAATRANAIVVASARRSADGWELRLELFGEDGKPHVVKAHSIDAILAAREASDRLLNLLGQHVRNEGTDTAGQAATELFQRVEAALLVDDFGAARRLLDGAPASLREQARAQLAMARIELGVDNLEAARSRFESLLSKTPAETEPVLRARALTGLGRTLADLNQLTAAGPQFSEAIALLEDRDEPVYLGTAYNDRGISYFAQGRYDKAAADYARARLAYDLARDTLGLARVDTNEATLDIQNDHPAEALPLLERAVQRLQPFGAISQHATALLDEIEVYLVLLQPAKALTVYEAAATTFDHLQDTTTLHLLEFARAAALAANGRLIEAQQGLDDLIRAADPKTEGRLLAWVQGKKAQIALQKNDADAAVTAGKRAIEAWDAQKYPEECSADWPFLIRALRKTGRNAEAAAELSRYTLCTGAVHDPHVTLYANLMAAEAAWGEGKRKAAAALYDDALGAAQKSGVPIVIAEVAVSYGNALLDVGDVATATDVIGQIARWSETDFASALLTARLYRALGRDQPWRAAMERTRALAGERPLPDDVASPPPGTATIVVAKPPP